MNTKIDFKKIKLNDNNYKLGNLKVTVIPVVIGAVGTVTEKLIKGLED